jgi:hypothetical protein
MRANKTSPGEACCTAGLATACTRGRAAANNSAGMSSRGSLAGVEWRARRDSNPRPPDRSLVDNQDTAGHLPPANSEEVPISPHVMPVYPTLS